MTGLVWLANLIMRLGLWRLLQARIFWRGSRLNSIGRTLGSFALFTPAWSMRQIWVLDVAQGHFATNVWSQYSAISPLLIPLIVVGTLLVQMLKDADWQFAGSTILGLLINFSLALATVAHLQLNWHAEVEPVLSLIHMLGW